MSFRENLTHPTKHHLRQNCQFHYQTLYNFLRARFIKTSVINDNVIKCMNQLATCKDIYNEFTILINILHEILPQVRQCGAPINASKDFENLYFDKGTACA